MPIGVPAPGPPALQPRPAEGGRKVAQMTVVTQVGPWECVESLGSGGNAKVWRATRDGGQTFVALNVLETSNKSKESYLRFVKEVEFLTSLDDMTGVLPVIEHHLPTDGDAEKPWLTMPIAISLDEALANAGLERVVERGAVRSDDAGAAR